MPPSDGGFYDFFGIPPSTRSVALRPKKSQISMRRLYSLSKELAGVILQHDHFGTHLNQNGEQLTRGLRCKTSSTLGRLLQKFSRILSSMVIPVSQSTFQRSRISI